ncbi:MAG: hypothetical protein RQ761_05390 [Bacteroidales bacterium]|nr:hypothetical protein [Bacteroidales bacterium]
MKRALYISVAVLFLLLTTGVSISMHYSAGELFSVAIFGEAESCCDDWCDCCSDETVLIQFTDNYMFSAASSPDAPTWLFEFIDFPCRDQRAISAFIPQHIYLFADRPPPKTSKFLAQLQSYLL